ncbi:MAG: hypothetical protein HY645_04660 [Acidobacteria bacterium]|nr:hypothetical protein [Acidobacteriota bacterium]
MRLLAYIYIVFTLVLFGVLELAGAEHPVTGTELRVRLMDTISTEDNEVGDRFTARVVSPAKYEGSTAYGRISSIQKSGKLKGRTRLGLRFDRIDLAGGGSVPVRADVIRVYESEDENVRETSEEGSLETGKQSKEALKRGAIGAAAGAVIGGLAGGKTGAAIGILVGGAGGAGSVWVTGRKELELERGTEMLIRVR